MMMMIRRRRNKNNGNENKMHILIHCDLYDEKDPRSQNPTIKPLVNNHLSKAIATTVKFRKYAPGLIFFKGPF